MNQIPVFVGMILGVIILIGALIRYRETLFKILIGVAIMGLIVFLVLQNPEITNKIMEIVGAGLFGAT